MAEFGRRGGEGFVLDRKTMEWQERRGLVRRGVARQSAARQAGLAGDQLGVAWFGVAGTAWS